MSKPFDHKKIDKLAEAAKTNRDSFSELYGQLFEPIFHFVFKRVGGNRFQSEEIVSTTFEKVLLKIDSYKEAKGHFASWVFRIANNNLIDYYRRRKDVANIENVAPGQLAVTPAAEEAVYRRELREELLRAIGKLGKKDQMIVALRFFQDYSNQEIAEMFGRTPNYIAVRVFRSLRFLRGVLGPAEARDNAETRRSQERVEKRKTGRLFDEREMRGRELTDEQKREKLNMYLNANKKSGIK